MRNLGMSLIRGTRDKRVTTSLSLETFAIQHQRLRAALII